MAKAEAKRRCSSALRRTPSAETTFIVICNEGVAIATQQITPDKFGSETSPDTADGDASFWLPSIGKQSHYGSLPSRSRQMTAPAESASVA